jgi:hypothetical protein
MKPLPSPDVPGNTDWERFDNAVSIVLRVPKEALLVDDAKRKAKFRRKRTRATKKAT